SRTAKNNGSPYCRGWLGFLDSRADCPPARNWGVGNHPDWFWWTEPLPVHLGGDENIFFATRQVRNVDDHAKLGLEDLVLVVRLPGANTEPSGRVTRTSSSIADRPCQISPVGLKPVMTHLAEVPAPRSAPASG